jgi:hypothetical protein
MYIIHFIFLTFSSLVSLKFSEYINKKYNTHCNVFINCDGHFYSCYYFGEVY